MNLLYEISQQKLIKRTWKWNDEVEEEVSNHMNFISSQELVKSQQL